VNLCSLRLWRNVFSCKEVHGSGDLEETYCDKVAKWKAASFRFPVIRCPSLCCACYCRNWPCVTALSTVPFWADFRKACRVVIRVACYSNMLALISIAFSYTILWPKWHRFQAWHGIVLTPFTGYFELCI
jgi:hypothetical protein